MNPKEKFNQMNPFVEARRGAFSFRDGSTTIARASLNEYNMVNNIVYFKDDNLFISLSVHEECPPNLILKNDELLSCCIYDDSSGNLTEINLVNDSNRGEFLKYNFLDLQAIQYGSPSPDASIEMTGFDKEIDSPMITFNINTRINRQRTCYSVKVPETLWPNIFSGMNSFKYIWARKATLFTQIELKLENT